MDGSRGRTDGTPQDTELSVKLAGTILVSDVRSELSTNDIHIYFQKKKNGGGEVIGVSMSNDRRKALVYFEQHEVAEAVAQRQEHVIKLCPVKVQQHKTKKTVLISNLPEGATENTIITHFRNKENGGGEIEYLEILKERKALVIFKNEKVAGTVVNTKQILTRDRPNETEQEEDRKKKERTVVVSGLPEGVTENNVHIYFQKKKNNGGEVEKIILLPEGKRALVIFEDPIVAEKVAATKHTLKGSTLKVKLQSTDSPTENSAESPEKTRTILVSNLPEGAMESTITIHFQKEKNGGGDVEKVDVLLKGNSALVVLEDPEVAKRVADTEQTYEGNVLNVKLHRTDSRTRNSEESPEKTRTILVTNLPEEVTESTIHIHFQKKRNGGGEVEKVEVLPEGNSALVVFQDPEVAKRVADTEQTFKGNVLNVKLQSTDSATENSEERPEKTRTIFVSNLPEGTTESASHIHFQKKKNSGEVEKVEVLPEGNSALVEFEDPEVAKTAVATPQEMKGKFFTVKVLKQNPPDVKTVAEEGAVEEHRKIPEAETAPEMGKPEVGRNLRTERTADVKQNLEETRQIPSLLIPTMQIDQVFSTVSAIVNPGLLKNSSPSFWTDVFNIIQKSCGVHCQPSTYNGVLFTGSLSQVVKAAEILELQRRKYYQALQSHQNVDHRSGTESNESSTTFDQKDLSFNQASTQFNNVCTHFNQTEPCLNHPDPNLNVEPPRSEAGPTVSPQPPDNNDARTTSNPTTTSDKSTTAADQLALTNEIQLGFSPGNPQPHGNQQPPDPSYMPRSPNPTIMNKAPASGGMPDPRTAKPQTPADTSSNPQSGNDQNGTTTDTTRKAVDRTTNVNRIPQTDNSDLNGKPPSSEAGLTIVSSKPPDNNKARTIPNPTTTPENPTAAADQFASDSKGKAASPSGKPLNVTINITSGKSTVNNEQSTTGSHATQSATTENQSGLPSKDSSGSLTGELTSITESIAQQKTSDNNQEAPTRNLTSGAQHSRTSNKKDGSSENDKPGLLPGKPQSSPDHNNISQPLDNDQQGATTKPTSGVEHSATNNKEVESSENEKPGLLPGKPPSSPDHNTTSQSPEKDLKATTRTTTAPQSPTNNEVPFGDTPDTTTEKPSSRGEVPNNQAEHNQRQTTHDQFSNQETSTPQNLNNTEITHPNNSPAFKPRVKPRSPTENNANHNSSPKQTPTPTPRQNKPGSSRQNAANIFSHAGKQTQTNQRHPSPTELNNNTGTDRSTAKLNEENDHDTTAPNSTEIITKDPETTGDSGNQGNSLENSTNTSRNIDAKNASNDKTKQGTLTKSGSNSEVDNDDNLDALD